MTQPRLLGGRYELDRIVGRGGMAEVYRARDLRLDRVVAVKTLREDLARDQTFQARFRREAQSAASLNHPSIVAVYDTGEDNSGHQHVPFIVMEYVDGRTIRDLLRDDRRLLPERSLEITDGVLRALDYSHRAGIVHRDIKPGNVMLNRQGEIKVMDFGIARAVADTQATMTQTAQVIGTAQYLSPEQARGERVDSRSDLYSVGCLLYELLTGRPPFTGDSPVAIAYQHVRENPVPPSRVDPTLPAWADPIVLRAMEKDPADRYQTAAEMRSDIQRALSGVPVAPALPATAAYAGPGTRRLEPTSDRTALAGQTGGLPPYQYDQSPDRARRARGRRPVWPWIVAAVALLAIIGVVIVYQTLAGGSGGSISVPQVKGDTVQKADAAIVKAGLQFRNVAVHTVTGTPNRVTKTSPAFGAVVPKNSVVKVYYNVLPSAKKIPDVSGQKLSVAEATLRRAGFTNLIQGPTVASLTVGSGDVISTNPPAGTTESLSTPITLRVSGGGVAVPDVDNLPLQQAEAKVQAANLAYALVTEPGPPGTAPGTVWKTTPGPFKAVLPGGTVTLYVEPGSASSSPPASSSPSPSASSSPSPSSSPSGP